MKSKINRQFRARYRSLPPEVQRAARRAFRLFSINPRHRSLKFKKVKAYPDHYSVRISADYRAVGIVVEGDTIIWFFIGSHAEYDKLIG